MRLDEVLSKLKEEGFYPSPESRVRFVNNITKEEAFIMAGEDYDFFIYYGRI